MKPHRAARVLRERFGAAPEVGLVLGSGLSGVASRVEVEAEVPYDELPDFAPSRVAGHPGRLTVGTWAGRRVAVLAGRVHAYEGHPAARVVLPVTALADWGIGVVVLTNAAGGIAEKLSPGCLMLIEDHINLTGSSPLVGPHSAFVDMTDAYDSTLRARLRSVPGFEHLEEGVYAGVLGPQYETPAEIRMLRAAGASAVGMSTVLETIALRRSGVRVAGISCITNRAAGLSGVALDHADVQQRARALQDDLSNLVDGFLRGASGIASSRPTR